MAGSCFVQDCKEGYKKTRMKNKRDGTENKTLFKVPKDPLLLKKWTRAMGQSDMELQSEIHYICERHFEEHCLVKYYETVMPDGTVHRIKRGRTSLKRNAVPSIFPCSPPTVEQQYGKSSRDHAAEECAIVYRDMSFDELKRKVRSLPLPNERWFNSCVDQSLVLFKVNSDQDIVKQIVISKDLTLNVFVDDKPFYVKTPTNIPGVKVVMNVLKTVDRLQMCEGTGIDICLRAARCFGYAVNDKNICVECTKKKRSLIVQLNR